MTQFQKWLLPSGMESDIRFQTELLASSRAGLRMLGAMEFAIALFLLPETGGLSWHFGLVAAVALLTIALASAAALRAHVRAVAIVSGWLVALALVGDHHILFGELSLLVFAVISAVPLIPLQTCVLGAAIGVTYGITGAWDARLQLFTAFLTCFATGISALLYAQKRTAFEAHRRSLEIQETLSTAQSRAQLAETAISLGRLAAALTHEINTPLGALKSAADTMVLLSAKRAGAKPEDQDRLAAAQADLSRSISDSTERLSDVVARLKRLIALERDDKQSLNLNDLLSDVRLMTSGKIPSGVRIEWKLGELPAISCSSNQLTTVFANLIANAASAIGDEGAITVETSLVDGSIRTSVHDTGRGMDADDVATAFDPGFKVQHGRVLGGNWSLFTARQIVNEHGGDIWLESRPGVGTTAYVTLPAPVRLQA